ncbi:hypothetical protein IP88_04975 [alpha proteobacterium AAP81b]|nr:hypothetical protein IP88_04975 [alpha proteobacterium AAP81b]
MLRLRFVAAILLGSFLLFLVQPLFGRLVLPVLGGSPQVWNTAMLFYQSALLGGYLYADRVSRLSPRLQLGLHLALFAVAALSLPIGIAGWYPPAGSAAPTLWLIGLLAVSVGPVFFVVSAQSPLLQAWFARSNDPRAANPYFLYAASNLGSFAALLAYPLLVEPWLGLADQRWLWSAGFVALALLTGLAGLAVRDAVPAPRVEQATSWGKRARWTLLAALPSGLLLSTTTHLTTDIMAMPLLWVVPLALYLLSFVLAFSNAGPAITRATVAMTPVALLLGGSWACFQAGAEVGTTFAVVGLALLFIVALALHGTLAAERPPAEQLTDFYVWLSVGGALGGVFCALVAPLVFDWPYEHPLLLLAVAAVVPAAVPRLLRPLWQRPVVAWLLVVAVFAASAIGAFGLGAEPISGRGATGSLGIIVIVIYLAAITAIGRPAMFTALFAALVLTLGGWGQLKLSAAGAHHRSFFGVYTVKDIGPSRFLMHGTTLHGQQALVPALATLPMTYYAPQSGVGLVFGAAPALFGPRAQMAFIGLGTGTLSCYRRPGQNWTAFEIDPVIVDLARARFSYLAKCAPDLNIVLGDARLTVAAQPAARLDALAVDAFSSDAIPLHLLTREAFRVYGGALKPDGVLLVHISNRFLDLEPVIAAIAAAEGWQAVLRDYSPAAPQRRGQMFSKSSWVALSRSPARLAQVQGLGAWRPLVPRTSVPAWRDDFASVLPVMRPLERAGLYR